MKNKFFTLLIASLLFTFSVNAQDFGFASKLQQTERVQGLSYTNKSTMRASLKSGKALIIAESFDSEIPATWTVEADAGAVATWGWTDGYANIDSDAAGGAAGLVAGTLTSPTVDATGGSPLYLAFDHFYQHLGTSLARVEVYDGADWVEVATYTSTTVDMDHVEIDVSDYINADFAVRFYYTDNDEWDYYWHVDNVFVYWPEPHDLGVDDVAPTFAMLGESVIPQVTVHNNGAEDETSFDVQLVITGTNYDEIITFTETIAIGADVVIDFPEWTNSTEGTYDITATVTVADDTYPDNDVMTISCSVLDLADAYTANYTAGIYNEITIADGSLNPVGTLEYPFPTAEEYADGTIYRFNEDMSFGTVALDGTYSNMGVVTGYIGIPLGLAYNWESEVMYVLLLEYADLSPTLCTLDLETLVVTVIGTGTGQIYAMDFADDGFLYGPAVNDSNLYKINPATGATTIIGNTGLSLYFGQDVSFNYDDGKLYTINCGAQHTYGTYDLTTGAFTQIADMGDDQYATIAITNEPSSVSINEIYNNKVSVYPNPSNGIFTVTTEEKGTLEIFDIKGKVINTQNINGSTQVELDIAGLYFIRISNENGSTVSRVVVK